MNLDRNVIYIKLDYNLYFVRAMVRFAVTNSYFLLIVWY